MLTGISPDVKGDCCMAELRFDDRVAIVTGGARGVGRCHALSLASRGAKVVIMDPGPAVDGAGTSQGPATEVVKEIVDAGGEAVASFESVTDESGAARTVQLALDRYGRVDILINNAGIADPELFEDQTTEQFRRMCEIQYLGTVYVTKAVWPHFMKVGGGRIVNTCSEGPLGIHGKLTTYGGAKGGVIGFTFTLAAEAPKHGIAVNGFSPRAGTRLSSPEIMSKTYDVPAEHFKQSMLNYPPELASPAAVYLAHESCPLNGVMLVCGGGVVLRTAFAQNEGFRQDDMSVEAIGENIDQIVDMSNAHAVELDSAQSVVSSEAAH
jgi:NAD(P)-dependent dehydrogenase (short-subunit alcohol dehydrogenase family)